MAWVAAVPAAWTAGELTSLSMGAALGAAAMKTFSLINMSRVVAAICGETPAPAPFHAPFQNDDAYPRPQWLRTDGTFNWGLLGASGVGKSTLLNSMRRLRASDPGAARVGVTETTSQPTRYDLPQNPYLKLWDLPGVGTPTVPLESYVADVGLRHFDAIILVTRGRWTETDQHILSELKKFHVPFVIVRTKIDEDAINAADDTGRSETDTIEQIRNDVLHQSGAQQDDVYLVSAKTILRDPPQVYDFERFLARVVSLTQLSRLQTPRYWINRNPDVTATTPLRYDVTDTMRAWAETLARASDHCGHFANARVAQLIRVENYMLYRLFRQAAQNLRTLHDGEILPILPLQPAVPSDFSEGLDDSINEVYLWHGTRRSNIDVLLNQGFDPRVASLDGNLYGAGVYFSSEACESYHYADKYKRERILLLCRVVLGNPFYATGPITPHVRCPPCLAGCQPTDICSHGRHDSVVANPGISTGLITHQVHREFIVYGSTSVYPEYLVRFQW